MFTSKVYTLINNLTIKRHFWKTIIFFITIIFEDLFFFYKLDHNNIIIFLIHILNQNIFLNILNELVVLNLIQIEFLDELIGTGVSAKCWSTSIAHCNFKYLYNN